MIKMAFFENIIIMICFTIIAIWFDKWWIALLSILFTNTIEMKGDK